MFLLFLGQLDVSHNELTHSIPDYLFYLPELTVFSAMVNCFQGSIPLSICNSTTLQELILDGLHTAPSCRGNPYFSIPGIYASASYPITESIVGSIPSCVFALPNLQLFHFSGNGLRGSLAPASGQPLQFGPKLHNMSLAYNLLTGVFFFIFFSYC